MSPIPRFLLPRPFLHLSTPRIFTRSPSSLIRNASTTPKKLKKRAPERIIKTTSPLPQTGKYFSLTETLGNSDRPAILLYAHHHRKFLLSCYGLASGMLAWSYYTYRTNIANARPGLPAWVTKASWGSITIMTVMAVAVGYYPTRLIQVIYAHPIPATATRPASISLTLHRRPILPTLPMKKLHVASPNMVSLGEPLHPTIRSVAEPVVEDTQTGWQKVWSKISPIKIFARAINGISTSGFVLLKVEGMGGYRIHRDGWVWERRGLDRIFKVRNAMQP
ncbi:hypothetical protein L873DRAFT_1840296 [Choiromyces venosus 120613-1]|uniref:Uncharacterized protein n=1 Tax=Choiromyces venosus 120613-1 TaxID=1336337 RepID=A0A3N4K5N6_9PEZI|nr:hypothetical protein L873DRAFT_1840296 [Choiromyces venosus 120613-1]